jgi:hypothetical protein
MKSLVNQVFQLEQMSAHLCLFIVCFFTFMIPVQILTVGMMSQMPNGFFFLGIIPMGLAMLGFVRLMTTRLEATADSLGLSLKVTKKGLFGSNERLYFDWESLQTFQLVRGKSQNVTMHWADGTAHRFAGSDMNALYEYLKYAFPEREHKGWW